MDESISSESESAGSQSTIQPPVRVYRDQVVENVNECTQQTDSSHLSPDNSAIFFLSQAILETPESHQLRQALGQYLEVSDVAHSEEEKANSSILLQKQGVLALRNENSAKVTALQNLAQSLYRRSQRLGNLDDLDQAIPYLSEAAMLASLDDYIKPTLFWNLAELYYYRSERVLHPGNLDQAFQYYDMALSLMPDNHPKRPNVLLGHSRCCLSRFEVIGDVSDLDFAISMLPGAVLLVSEDHALYPNIMNTLGSAYASRFYRLGEAEDIDMAIGCKTQAMQRASGGTSDREMWLSDLAGLYFARYERLGQHEDSQNAINYQRAAVILVSENDSEQAILLGQLGDIYRLRFERTGNSEDCDQAIECFSQVASLTSEQDPKKTRALMSLAPLYRHRLARNHNPDDLTKTINGLVQLIDLLPEGHPEKAITYTRLGGLYHSRFELSLELPDIDKEIEYLTLALASVSENNHMQTELLYTLAGSLEIRHKQTGNREDADQAISYYRRSSQALVADPIFRFRAAHSLAKLESSLGPISSLQGYQAMVDLLPQVLWIGLVNRECYRPEFNIEEITTEVISAAIAFQAYETALTWFNTCRLGAWKETLQLRRAPLAHLRSAYPVLASTLEQVALELDKTPFQSDERAAHARRRSAEMWDSLLAEVRALPEFEEFLMPEKMAELFRAARSRDVVVVNVHESRCDALIIPCGQEVVSHVPLPTLTVHKVMVARSKMDTILKSSEPQTSQETESAFENVLEMLWDDVVRPVLEDLGHMVNVGNQLPHITWCLTGLLSGLPLHAAGRYTDPPARIYDYVVSSYAPNLSLLLGDSPSVKDLKNILLVDQVAEDQTDVHPEISKELVRLKNLSENLEVADFRGSMATTEAVHDGIDKKSWIHLACHVSQNATHPTTSAFHLHDGELSLADIMSKPRNNGGVVFLLRSAVVERDTKEFGEAFPIATGMIMAGFSTVLTTLWVAEDQDVALVTEGVYARLMDEHDGRPGQVARCLHCAVAQLRSGVGEKAFLRWLSFIHIGL